MEELQTAWKRVLSQIELQVSKPTFKTWFAGTVLLEKENGLVKVGVPSHFVREWLQNKFNLLLLRIVRELYDDVKSIEYSVLSHDGTSGKKRFLPSSVKLSPQLNIDVFEIDPETNLNPRYRFDNFVVGGNNELAFAASQAVVQKPALKYNPLFLYGGVGLGKTHLLEATGNEVVKQNSRARKVKYITSEKFTNELVNALKNHQVDEFKTRFREVDVFILDDVQFMSGKDKSQEELFHTFNTLYERNKQIIFSSDRPPSLISDIEDRLRSRFEGGVVVDITAPDFETRLAILKLKTQEKGVDINQRILEVVAQKIQKNIRELEGILNQLVLRYTKNKKITLDEVESVLKDYASQLYKSITPKQVLQVVCSFYEIADKDLLGKKRKKELVKPRQIVMYLLRDLAKMSYPSIGEKLGSRDHTTVIYSCEKIEREVKANQTLFKEIEILKERISHS